MSPVDREPGGSTMIRVSIEVRDELNKLKVIEREAVGDVVKRLIKDNQRLHKLFPTTQTKDKMEKDLRDYKVG